MLKFSLIVPTRKRQTLFLNLIDSIIKTTAEIDNIEILAVVDSDDQEAIEYTEHNLVKRLIRLRGNNISRDYHTYAYSHSCGKYIFVLNDDCELKTDAWDIIAWNKLEGHDVVYGKTSDDGNQTFSYFPILNRMGIDALGHVMSPFFPGWGADEQLFHVYKEYVVDLCEVIVSHIQGCKVGDECYQNMTDISMNIPPDEFKKILLADKDRLKFKS